MYTKEDLKKCMADMGLKPTDALMVHSSMKAGLGCFFVKVL